MKKKTLIWLLLAISVAIITSIILLLSNPQRVFTFFGPFESNIYAVNADISKEVIQFDFYLEFESKVPFEFFIERIEYHVSFDSTEFSKGAKSLQRSFKQHEQDTLILPLKMNLPELSGKMKSFEHGDSTIIHINLSVFVQLPFIGVSKINVPIKKFIAAPLSPKFEVNDVSMKDFGLKEMELLLSATLTNENAIALNISDAHFTMDFPKLFKGSVQFDEVIKINAKDKTNVEAVIEVTNLQLVRDGLKIVFKNHKWDYVLKGSMKVSFEGDKENAINLTINNSGETHLLKRRIRSQE